MNNCWTAFFRNTALPPQIIRSSRGSTLFGANYAVNLRELNQESLHDDEKMCARFYLVIPVIPSHRIALILLVVGKR